MAVYVPKANRQPHLFLSHSSKDKDFVIKLANDLAVCEVDVWLDEWEIGPGDSIYKAISEGIEFSRYIALVVSKPFLESTWVSEEVESAFAKQMEQRRKVILPIKIEDIEMPSLLKGKQYISFIEDYYHSLTKLAAIIHDIDLQTLSQAINTMNPQSLKESIDTLAYCGLDPHMIIPKIVFDEISGLDGVEVYENRLRFHDLGAVYKNEALSGKAKFYLERVWTGNESKHRWLR